MPFVQFVAPLFLVKVPTSFNDMFLFNAAVMGFSESRPDGITREEWRRCETLCRLFLCASVGRPFFEQVHTLNCCA